MDETFPNIGAMSDEELKSLIEEYTRNEEEVSFQRRILHGRIDILRAELVNRLRVGHESGDTLITGADIDKLSDILSGRVDPGDKQPTD